MSASQIEPRTTLTFRLGALLVRGAGVLVPPRKRPDWRREWEAELWYAVFLSAFLIGLLVLGGSWISLNIRFL